MVNIRKIAFEVKWHVENVTFWFQTRDDPIYNPQFLASTLKNTRWKLSLSTNWQLNEKYLNLTVHRDVEDNGPEFISLNYELAYLASDDSKAITKLCKSRFAAKTESNKLSVKYGEIFKQGLEAYLPEGVLTIFCQFWYAWPKVSKSEQYLIRSVIGTKCITSDGSIYNYHGLSLGTRDFLNFSSPSSDISFISFWLDENKKFRTIFETNKVDCKRFTRYNCRLFFLDGHGLKMASYNMKNPETSLTLGSHYEFELCISEQSFTNFTEYDRLLLQLEITYFPGVESESIEYDFNKTSVQTLDGESTGTKDMDPSSENPNNISQQGYEKNYTKVTGFEESGSINEAECFDVDRSIFLPLTTMKTDLTSLYNDRLFCDTKLKTDIETFPAHRCVLSARSPVFKKMFTTDMKEAMGEGINIPDINADTVRRMLQFLYTDCIGDLDMQSAKDLYIASDKYDIVSLKQLCLTFMKDNLCPANVCEVLVLADMHQDKDLESSANEYIMNYDDEVFSSEEWRVFMQNYSGLAARVMFMKIRNK